MDNGHTPTPWRVEKAFNGNWIEAGPASCRPVSIARTRWDDVGSTVEDANAAFIVRAVNAHDDLIAALEKAEQFIVNGVEMGFIRMPDPDTPDTAHDTLPAIRAALAKASSTTEGEG